MPSFAPSPRKSAVPGGADPGVGGGPEVPVTAGVGTRRAVGPGQSAVAHVQGDDGLGQRLAVVEVAVSGPVDDQAQSGKHRSRRPHASAPVVEHLALGVGVGLVLPHRVSCGQAGTHDVPPVPLGAVDVHAEGDDPVVDDGRREDAGAVGVRARGLVGPSRVVVLPVHRTGGGVQCVQRIAATEDDEGWSARGRRFEPGRGRDQPAVGGEVAVQLTRIGRDGVLGHEPGLPTQRPGLEIDGVEVVVPRADVDDAVHHRRGGCHGVAGGKDPGFAQRLDRRPRQRGPTVKRVLGVVTVGGPVPRSGCGGNGRDDRDDGDDGNGRGPGSAGAVRRR